MDHLESPNIIPLFINDDRYPKYLHFVNWDD